MFSNENFYFPCPSPMQDARDLFSNENFCFCTCNPSQRSVVATHDQKDGGEYLFQQIFIKTLPTNL